MKQLTIQQAKEQGYTHFGYSDQGYQSMYELSDPPFRWTGKECLFKKDPEPGFTVMAENVKDILVDKISDKWLDQTDDDTGEMNDFLNAIPIEKFEGITKAINEAAANKHYYKLTEIQLIP